MKHGEKEFEKLVSDYLDEELAPGQLEELAATLSSDPDLLDHFVDRTVIEAGLHRRGETAAAMDISDRDRIWGRTSKHQWLGSIAAAAAILVLAGVFLYMIQVRDVPPFAELRVSPHAMVTVGEQGGNVQQGNLEKGSTVTVTQGSAELRLKQGVVCLLQAPGSMRFEDTGRVRLEQGKARFFVEEKARGFRVATEFIEVIDLGTDFGIDLSVPDQPQVHVIRGKVEVRSLSGRKQHTRLDEGNAVALGAVGSLQSVPLDAKRFPGELPTGIPALHFSFDVCEGNMLPATGALADQTGARLLLDHDRAPALTDGRFGKALLFDHDRRYAQTNWMGIGGTQGRTISLWIRTAGDTDEESMMLMGWGAWTGPSRMSNLGLRLSGGRNHGRLRVVSGQRWLEGSSPLNDGHWHHLLVCMGEYSMQAWPETKVFIDGRPEEMTPRLPEDRQAAPINTFFTEVNGIDSTPVIFGQMAAPGSSWPLRWLHGQMDEVIIAAGVVTEAQARALYEGRLEDSGLDLGL